MSRYCRYSDARTTKCRFDELRTPPERQCSHVRTRETKFPSTLFERQDATQHRPAYRVRSPNVASEALQFELRRSKPSDGAQRRAAVTAGDRRLGTSAIRPIPTRD